MAMTAVGGQGVGGAELTGSLDAISLARDDSVAITTLDSGMRVVTERMAEVRSVALGFWVGVGSRDEGPEQSGASHFLEHLLFKGTATWGAREIAEAIDGVGGEMNAFTTKEYTVFYLRLLDEHLDLGLDILCDIMQHPALRPEDVDAERQVILEEILMHADEPADLVAERFAAAMFPGHPLGREVAGTKEIVEQMGSDDIREFFERHYVPASMVFAAAGALEHERIVAGINSRFQGPWRSSTPTLRSGPLSSPVAVSVLERPTEQAHVVLGMPSCARVHEDRWALSILNHVLGGGMSSRLFQEVRERRGLAYSVWSDRTAFSDAGTFSVSAGTAPRNVKELLKVFTAELDRMRDGGITERELEVAHGKSRAETVMALEDSGARMSRLGSSLLLEGEVREVEDILATLEAVSVDDTSRIAAEYLGLARTLAVVGPFEADAFEDLAG